MSKSQTPVHLKLEQDILNDIRAKNLKPEQILSSESEFSKQYGISRSSVRIALRKLRNKGLVYSMPGIECTAVKDRFEGYEEALRDYKILLDLSLVKKVPQNDKFLKEEPLNGGYQEAKELLKEKPTAIFATNDFLARSTLKAIKEEGLSIPEDISLIGFDNQKFSEYLGLTTIAQPFYEMGAKAAQILLKKVCGAPNREKFLVQGGEEKISKICLEPELIVRESCREITKKEVLVNV